MRSFFTEPPPADAVHYGNLRIWRINEKNGKHYCKAWRGKQSRPYAYHSFRDADAREFWINQQIKADEEHMAWRAARKASRIERAAQMRATIKPGMILHGSWGYDQTNCELYQVVEVRGAVAVIRPIRTEHVSSGGPDSEYVRPVRDGFCGEPIRRTITASGVKLHECCDLTPTDETQKHYSSWYA